MTALGLLSWNISNIVWLLYQFTKYRLISCGSKKRYRLGVFMTQTIQKDTLHNSTRRLCFPQLMLTRNENGTSSKWYCKRNHRNSIPRSQSKWCCRGFDENVWRAGEANVKKSLCWVDRISWKQYIEKHLPFHSFRLWCGISADGRRVLKFLGPKVGLLAKHWLQLGMLWLWRSQGQ